MRPLLLLALLLASGAATQPAPAHAPPEACGAPAELLGSNEPLGTVARALRGGALRVLVTGSASALGPGTSTPAAAWPARLEALLVERQAGLRVAMHVRGGRGLTAADMAGMIEGELARGPIDLVLWQTGTVEAVRGIDPDELTATLNAGLERMRAAGVDAVLIDPQFSRFFRANANVDPYLEAMRAVANAHGVPLLRRYELMRLWVEEDRVDLERAPRAEKTRVTDQLNDCLARATAALLLDGAAAAEARPAPR